VALCVAAAIAAISYFFLLFVGKGSSSASQLSPEDFLFSALGGVFTVILVGIALRYVYYYYCWFVSRRDFGSPRHVDVAALAARDVPYLKFQVTTRGGALPVVERSLTILEDACRRHPWLAAKARAEVITERAPRPTTSTSLSQPRRCRSPPSASRRGTPPHVAPGSRRAHCSTWSSCGAPGSTPARGAPSSCTSTRRR
jgi:hypothetical protein